jgi:cytochrome c-type biogenesis protein CcmH
VRGTIRVAPELADRVPGGAVLFLIARGPQPGPPLAVKRIPAPRFPLDFELGPDDRMIAAIPFRGPLTLSARIDADQNAMTRNPGDLQGAAATPVEPGARDVSIVIDEIL